jgi:hypothetical protein
MLVSSSLYDTILSDEGTIDPLGFTTIADRLADKLAPGVRERMRHPRFLTAIAAGAHVCQPFQGTIAADGHSEPSRYMNGSLFRRFIKSIKKTFFGLEGCRVF